MPVARRALRACEHGVDVVECRASAEAVVELMEERGLSACPFCGRPPEEHESEVEWDDERR